MRRGDANKGDEAPRRDVTVTSPGRWQLSSLAVTRTRGPARAPPAFRHGTMEVGRKSSWSSSGASHSPAQAANFGYPRAKSGAVWQFRHPSGCGCRWLPGTSPRSGGERCQKRAAAPKFGVGGERLLAPRVFAGMGMMLRISHPGVRRRVRPPTPELPPERRMLCGKKNQKSELEPVAGAGAVGSAPRRDALSGPEVASCWEGLGSEGAESSQVVTWWPHKQAPPLAFGTLLAVRSPTWTLCHR